MKYTTVLIVVFSSLFIISGCSDQADNKTTQKSEQLQNTETQAAFDPHANLKTPVNRAAAPAAEQLMNGGIATNVIHSGGYTYVEIIDKGKSIWLAGSQTPVEPGQQIYWGEAALMRNFTSKSLNRTFAEILFVSKFNVQQRLTQKQKGINLSKGIVLSVQNAAGYSYLEVNTSNGNIWIAAPEATIEVNDNISWNESSKMVNFTSKSLDKTFAEIFFVGSVSVLN